MRHPAQAYRQFAVQGASPLALIVMLYDGAIAAFERTITAINQRDIEGKCTHLNRAFAIIAQLEGALNFEQGGEVAKTLQALYSYTRAQAHKANLQNSPEILRAVIEKLSVVREAWYQADHPPATEQAPPAPDASKDSSSMSREPGNWQMSG